jgi:hypothetical protein
VTAVTLTDRDEPRHTRGFCRPDVQPDLFGQWFFIRECGCIGPPGQTCCVLYPPPWEAGEALGRQRRRKERSGRAAPRKGAS